MRKTSASSTASRKHRVYVVESGVRARRDRIKCEIGENLKFNTSGLEAYCFANWDVRVFDAFVVAAAVQFCDHTKARPSTGWRRHIALNVPVHEPDHWVSTAVSGALHDALSFVTGDRWEINFRSRKVQAPSPCQQRFNLPDDSLVIVPFSDGLDSLAVSRLAEQEHGDKLLRVRLGTKSANGHATSQPRPFGLVPYRVSYGKRSSVEPSSRSRGFKFALLSGIAAYLSQAQQIIIPESGQGALGPTLVPVGQAYEDYRNHPLFTNRMEAFLRALFGHNVRYAYPRLWQTKSETLKEFVEKCADGAKWTHTRSCWRGQRQVSVSGKMRQCGICAACMLRRMSAHAIGHTEEEDKEVYVWENLSAARFDAGAAPAAKRSEPSGANYEYAIAGTLHLHHLADILNSTGNQSGLNLQVFQLSQALGIRESDIRIKLERLLRQHEKEWKDFVDFLGPKSFVTQWVLGA